MGKLTEFVLLCIFVILYFIGFHFLNYGGHYAYASSEEIFSSALSSEEQKIGICDSVHISFFRDRFFYDMDSERIYFFGFLPLPYEIAGVNVWWFHMLTGFLFTIWILLLILKPESRRYGQ